MSGLHHDRAGRWKTEPGFPPLPFGCGLLTATLSARIAIHSSSHRMIPVWIGAVTPSSASLFLTFSVTPRIVICIGITYFTFRDSV